MWRIEEHRRVDKQLAGIPQEILNRYEKWKGHRSSRLGLQYRIIYRAVLAHQLFEVVSITAHDYQRR